MGKSDNARCFTLVLASGSKGLVAVVVHQEEFDVVGGLLAATGAGGGPADLALADPDGVLLGAGGGLMPR